MGDDMPDELPKSGYGAGPPDEDRVADQNVDYDEAESLDPDESLIDPAVTT